MIQVRYRPSLEMPWIRVELPDDKLEAVLRRAGERIFPGPEDPAVEAETERRFQAIMAAREKRKKANVKLTGCADSKGVTKK